MSIAHATSLKSKHILHSVIIAITLARLSLAILMAVALRQSYALALLLLGAMIISDLLDGMIARKWGVDSNVRRVADSVIDTCSIHIVAISFILVNPHFLALYLPLAARDAVAATVCTSSQLRFRTLLIGGAWHKLSSLSKAGLLIAMMFGTQSESGLVAAAALLINVALLVDYVGAHVIVSGRSNAERTFGARFVCVDLNGVRECLRRIRVARPTWERPSPTTISR